MTNTNTTMNRRQSLALVLGAGAASLVYGGGMIGAGVAQAATNKPVAGVGIKICKNPGGSSKRIRAVASDVSGRFSMAVMDAGDQDVDIDKAALQMTVNAGAAAGTESEDRIVIVRFAPRLRVTGPSGQTAVPGQPGTFILTPGTQTFVVAGMAAGAAVSGSIETVDAGDLFPGLTARGIKDVGVKSCNGCGMTGRMIPRNDISPLPRSRVAG